MIRLAIAVEHEITRWALREVLANTAAFDVIGEASSIAETIELVRREKPEVVLLDGAFLDRSGPDPLLELRELDDGPLVVMLAAHDELSYGVRAVAAGVHGYVRRSDSPHQLLDAIRKVSTGERVIPPEIENLAASGERPAASLTRRELQVMEMIARGLTNREIGEHLAISVKTVDTHRGHVLKKLALRNNSDLTRYALKHGHVTI